MRRSTWLGFGFIAMLLISSGCQCEGIALKERLAWTGASCLRPLPNCNFTLRCQSGLWKCIKCIEGELQPCYTGPKGTEGKGACRGGNRVCTLGVWSICKDQVVPTKVDNCGNNVDDNCNGQTDENCDCDPNGPPRVCGQNVGQCKSGTQRCGPDGKWSICEGWIQPTGERCNGKDDDCDGKIDEDFKLEAIKERGLGQPCRDGKGSCQRSGIFVCNPNGLSTICNAQAGTATPEKCNGKDDDCDGQIDEDWPNKDKDCSNQQQGACSGKGKMVCKQDGSGLECNAPSGQPKAEECDNKDNDCDGQIDEDWPNKDKECSNQLKGVCARKGKWICSKDKKKLTCDASKPKPQGSDDNCDGKDDDCDGQTDEDFPDKDKTCSTGKDGICKDGKTQCNNGNVECKPDHSPKTEDCNNKDDDCDGQIDEDVPPKSCTNSCGNTGQQTCTNHQWSACDAPACCKDGETKPCKHPCGSSGDQECNNGKWGSCDAEPCCEKDDSRPCYEGPSGTEGVGICKAGRQRCNNGSWGKCEGQIRPRKEDCNNNKDDDCDGKTDRKDKDKGDCP